jgi:hypothetical protein
MHQGPRQVARETEGKGREESGCGARGTCDEAAPAGTEPNCSLVNA